MRVWITLKHSTIYQIDDSRWSDVHVSITLEAFYCIPNRTVLNTSSCTLDYHVSHTVCVCVCVSILFTCYSSGGGGDYLSIIKC